MNARLPISISTAPCFRPELRVFMCASVVLVTARRILLDRSKEMAAPDRCRDFATKRRPGHDRDQEHDRLPVHGPENAARLCAPPPWLSRQFLQYAPRVESGCPCDWAAPLVGDGEAGRRLVIPSASAPDRTAR